MALQDLIKNNFSTLAPSLKHFSDHFQENLFNLSWTDE